VEALQKVPAPVFARHQMRRTPKAFLSHRSIHGRYYYTKMRMARGKGARDAYAAACGMRWNYYLSHGKRTPHFAPHEHHKAAIASGLMSEIRHSRNSAMAGHMHQEAHEHLHATAYQAPTLTAQNVSHSPAYFQNVQLVHATIPHTQDGAGVSNPQLARFSFSIHPSASIEATAGPGSAARLHASTETGSPTTKPSSHHAGSLHFAAYSGSVSTPSSHSGTLHALAGATSAQTRQMDISLNISYDPMSQLSYRPTYQVGTYNATQAPAGAQIVPATLIFASQWNNIAAPQGGAAANPQRKEVGYYGSGRRKFVSLKVAQAADAVPE
jgi:hypothetical protein